MKQNIIEFGAIRTFTSFPELNAIMQKSAPQDENDSLATIIYNQNRFDLEAMYAAYPEYYNSRNRCPIFKGYICLKSSAYSNDKL